MTYRDDFPHLTGCEWEEAMDAAGHSVTAHLNERGTCPACPEPTVALPLSLAVRLLECMNDSGNRGGGYALAAQLERILKG